LDVGATSERSGSCCDGHEAFVQIKRRKWSLDFLVFTLSLSKGVSRQKHVKIVLW